MDEVGQAQCDPMGQANMPQTLFESAIALVALYFCFMTIALSIMICLSNKYE